MTLEEAQKQVDQWVKTYGVRYFSELTNMTVPLLNRQRY